MSKFKQFCRRLCKYIFLFYFGGATYLTVEIFYRNYTDISMFIVGGICFLLLGAVNIVFPWGLGLAWQALIGAGIITAVELAAGLIINRWLGLGVWDYSDMPFNILGQVCLLYSLAWVFLSVVGIVLDDYLRWKLYGEVKPEYKII